MQGTFESASVMKNKTLKFRNWLLWVCSIAMSTGLLAWAGYRLNPDITFAHLRDLNPHFLALLVVAALIKNAVVIPVKLKWILAVDSVRISYFESVMLRLTGLFLRLLLPLKLGDAARIIYLKRTHDYRASQGVGFLLFDKVTSLIGFGLLVLIGVSAVPGARVWAIPLGLVLAFLLLLVVTPVSGWVVEHVPRLPDRLRRIFDEIVRLFNRVAMRERWGLLIYSIAIEAYNLLFFYLAFRALGLHVPASSILICVPAIYMATALPVTVGGLGIRENAVILLLGKYGTTEQLFLAGALVSMFAIVLFAFVGAAFMVPLVARTVRGSQPVSTGTNPGRMRALADLSADDRETIG